MNWCEIYQDIGNAKFTIPQVPNMEQKIGHDVVRHKIWITSACVLHIYICTDMPPHTHTHKTNCVQKNLIHSIDKHTYFSFITDFHFSL